MPTSDDALAADATEFLTLLTTGNLEPEELIEATEALLLAARDPDAYSDKFLDEDERELLRVCGVATHVAATDIAYDTGCVCLSDKADELYDQLSEQFSEPLPELPIGLQYLHEYLRLADEAVRLRGPQPGGYELLELSNPYSDDLQVVLVFRKDTPRILELSQRFGVSLTRLNLTAQ